MPVSYIPSSPNQTPDQIDPRGIVQLALMVHQQKQADAQSKRSNALDLIKTVSENPDLATMIDSKKIEGAFKDAGMDLASPEQVAAMQKMIAGGGGAPQMPAPPAAAPVPSNQLEQLGNTMQGNKAGAQSATPPSSNAANKAPGGGVTPGGIVTPGSGQLQQLQESGVDAFTKKVGALAPLYMGAQSQKQAAYMIAQEQSRLGKLKQQVEAGGPEAVGAYGALMAATGQHVDPAAATAMMTSTDDPAIKKQGFDFFLHNESGENRVQRLTSTMTTLGSNKDFMGKLKDPTDLPRIAESIVAGQGVPQDLLKRPFSLDELVTINTRQAELVKQGFDPVTAENAAQADALGVPPVMSLPTAMHGMTIQQTEAQTKDVTAQGALLRGQGAVMEGEAALQRVQADHKKVEKTVDEQLKEKLENMLALQKGGVAIPQEMLDENLAKVAEQSGLTIARVKTLWHWYSGILEIQGKSSDSALQGQAPGGTPSGDEEGPDPIAQASKYGTASKKDVEYMQKLQSGKKKNVPFKEPDKEQPVNIPVDTSFTER